VRSGPTAGGGKGDPKKKTYFSKGLSWSKELLGGEKASVKKASKTGRVFISNLD